MDLQNKESQQNNSIIENDYMSLIYKHPAIEVRENNNFKYIQSIGDIKCGELVMIEHVFANSHAVCAIIVKSNEYLFDQYHPRTSKFSEIKNLDYDTVDKMVDDKLSHNCFSLDDKLVITDTITKMNHSCDPNCVVCISEKYTNDNTITIFMELFAIRNIKKDTEITISYGPKNSHERDFECKCGKSIENRIKHFNIVCNLAKYMSKLNAEIVKEKIYQYLETDLGKKILLNHYLATNGIFMNRGNVSRLTLGGEKIINDLIYKFMNIDPKNFNDTIKTGQITEQKLVLFKQILDNCLFNKD